MTPSNFPWMSQNKSDAIINFFLGSRFENRFKKLELLIKHPGVEDVLGIQADGSVRYFKFPAEHLDDLNNSFFQGNSLSEREITLLTYIQQELESKDQVVLDLPTQPFESLIKEGQKVVNIVKKSHGFDSCFLVPSLRDGCDLGIVVNLNRKAFTPSVGKEIA